MTDAMTLPFLRFRVINLLQSSTFKSPLQWLIFQFCWRPLGRAFFKGNPIYFSGVIGGISHEGLQNHENHTILITHRPRISFSTPGTSSQEWMVFWFAFHKLSYHQTEFFWECKRSKCRWKQRYSTALRNLMSAIHFPATLRLHHGEHGGRADCNCLRLLALEKNRLDGQLLRKTIPKDFERYDVSKRRQGLFSSFAAFCH